jgi:hypothetical protein
MGQGFVIDSMKALLKRGHRRLTFNRHHTFNRHRKFNRHRNLKLWPRCRQQLKSSRPRKRNLLSH